MICYDFVTLINKAIVKLVNDNTSHIEKDNIDIDYNILLAQLCSNTAYIL